MLTRLALIGLFLLTSAGCANLARPNWFNPGTVQQQRIRALHSDPYPDTDAGPEMLGVRPREFSSSLPEAVKNQPYSYLDQYGNPAFQPVYARYPWAKQDSRRIIEPFAAVLFSQSVGPMPGSSSSLIRLHKLLAEAGIGSRRKCEEIIQEGRVEVDGEFVTELGTSVDPTKQEIMVDGQRIRARRKQYFILNKPVGVVSTNFDQAGRTRVIDLVPQDERLFTIGRLDRQSEGLIIITNDGELANQLAHPRFGVPKTYHVEVAGSVSVEEIKMIQSGVYIAEGFVKAESCRLKQKRAKSSILEIILREGKNREIRRLLAKVGHKVLRLKRISIGPLKLGDVPAGSFRELRPSEVKALRDASAEGAAKGAPKRKPAGRRTTGTSPGSRPGKTPVKKGTTFRGGKKKTKKKFNQQQPSATESRRGQGRAVKQKQASKKKQMRRK